MPASRRMRASSGTLDVHQPAASPSKPAHSQCGSSQGQSGHGQRPSRNRSGPWISQESTKTYPSRMCSTVTSVPSPSSRAVQVAAR